jgi:dienelactone hydrolase
LLFDLLTPAEEDVDMESGLLRFDIGFLTRRLLAAAAWTARQPESAKLALGYFGASTGAAAALVAASLEPENVKAVVSRGGRPDLAGDAIAKVQAPTLLLVGGNDAAVLEMNREAAAKMTARHALEVVPGASHLFEEPGTLEEVARRAVRWFSIFLKG